MSELRRVWPGADQLALRSLVPLAALVVVWAAESAGARPPSWLQLSLLACAVLAGLFPESPAGSALLVGSAVVWAQTPESLSPWVLVAGAGMVAAHVAALIAAQGPIRMLVDRTQCIRWARRAVLVWMAATAIWALGFAARELPSHRTAYAAGLLLMAAIAAAAARRISTGPRP